MNNNYIRVFTAAAAFSILSLPVCAQSQTTRRCGGWSQVTGAVSNTTDDTLYGVSALPNGPAWAVGDAMAAVPTSLIIKWDGNKWTVDQTGATTSFRAVKAISATDVWAVGLDDHAAAWHYDGASWTRSSFPDPGAVPELRSVDALSSSDVWAVGTYLNFNTSGSSPFIGHWNGTTWSLLPVPVVSAALNSVSAVAANDVWAVGQVPGKGLILHWDGLSWKNVPLSISTSNPYVITTVSALSANDVWAGGYKYNNFGKSSALMLHWNGSSWTEVASVDPSGGEGAVLQLANSGPSQVWAIGRNVPELPSSYAFSEQWDGQRWNKVKTQNAGLYLSALFGLTSLPNGELWAVGYYQDNPGDNKQHIQRFVPCGL